jgi:hypothetical protein
MQLASDMVMGASFRVFLLVVYFAHPHACRARPTNGSLWSSGVWKWFSMSVAFHAAFTTKLGIINFI